MKSATFKYIDRNNKDSIVLIPGWATDYRIFDSLGLKFNYLIPVNFSPANFEKPLLEALKKNNIEKISLLGWSLGGFVAAEFASKHTNFIDELILVSIRNRYRPEELARVKEHLGKNKNGYLYKFYTQCFFKKENMRRFKKNLFKDYCQLMDLNYLFKTLDYLENAEIKPELLNNIKNIKIIHGEYDSIAPIEEAIDIKNSLANAKFICIKDAGHMPFVSKNWYRFEKLGTDTQFFPTRHDLKIRYLSQKAIIKRNFSRYAKYYDRYCSIQNFCAKKLIAKVGEKSFEKILDIGCGTGNYTKLLKDKFPGAQIKAIDISADMVEIAKEKLKNKEIEFIVADGETIDFKEHFDFISSNASFQWFEDLGRALLKYKKLLKKNGVISFSTFGPLTFYELDASLRELFGKNELISSTNFIKRTELNRILKRLFKKVEIDQQIHKETYHSLSELLKKIKYTGARGNGIDRKNFWTPRTIGELERVYRKEFNGIIATYQVFFCRGAK